MSTDNNQKKDKVLIIESSSTFGNSIADLLRQEGLETTLVNNANDGLKAVYDILPRLVLLNVTLQNGDSYDLLEKKNSESLLKKIPVVLISTQATPIIINKIPQGSVSEFIVLYKEDANEVFTKIKKYLGTSGDLTRATGKDTGSSDTPSASTKKKVLWVEDDKLIGNILGKKFLSFGFDLTHVKNADEALSKLAEMKPDVIVLDILLPGMGGLDLLQKIVTNPNLKTIPTMILSNIDKQSDKDKAAMLGAKAFIVKAGTSLEQIADEVKKLTRS